MHFILDNDIVCIFGQKELTLYRWSEIVESHFQTIQPIYQYDRFIDWIWDVCFVDKSTNDFSKLAIGTFHNAVILWNTQTNEPIECYYGKERCILYSMSIINLHGDFLVASGTVFSEVHIWSVHHPEKTHICKKHNGVIFKVRWNEDARCLLSVSDDRSVILWKHSSSKEPWWVSQPTSISTFLDGSYEVAMQCYGHTARLWDCLFTPSCIVTCSEDCTVRFWNVDGTCIGTFTGHEGKHIWCIAYSEKQQIILTGGNDNSIKIWNLNDILNSNLNTTISTVVIPTMMNHDLNEPRNSKSECIRELVASTDGQSIMVLSNWGYLWNYDIREKKWNSIYTPEEHQSVSCMEVGKNGIVVVGKMDGSVQFISTNHSLPNQEFHPCNHRITKILLDEENDEYSWVFVLSANSVIHVCKYFNNTKELIKQTSISLQGKSVGIALAWVHSLQLLCISDSIGCVTFFHLQESETIEVKNSITVRCHNHVPVTCLAWKDDCLWTGGNDGRIVALEVSVTPLKVTPQTPIIVPKIKQVLSIWWNDEDEIFCAGYQERLYYVYDLTSMVEVLTISAGGWKRPSTSASHPQHPNRGYTYAYASMNGFSEICVYSKEFEELSTSLPSINQVSHGREINVTHWLTRTNEGGILLTGGEDRKMQVVEVKRRNRTFDWIIHYSFEVHSSSIRCITSCKYDFFDGVSLLGVRKSQDFWHSHVVVVVLFVYGE